MHLCADFHAGPSKEYLIFFLLYYNLFSPKCTTHLISMKVLVATMEKELVELTRFLQYLPQSSVTRSETQEACFLDTNTETVK